ncbi:MAG: class I SAM-dependent methyltransferase [Lachnospiraceae bacterium]|nr:class I SAM-dependent methyltransferase [Lachnospiraceae bacterium]
MEEYSRQNKKAWEYNTYEFWVTHSGTPQERAKKDLEDPVRMLRKYAAYFDTYQGIRVANICGSCGKKAVPLAILGADVTVFDISEQNRRYAMEVAEAAGIELTYVVGDVLDIDLEKYGNRFDVVFMEGGILSYFHDIDQFMRKMHSLLKPGGKMICSDFHPFIKIADVLNLELPTMSYFSTDVFEGEMAHARFFREEIRRQMPKCSYRKYTVSEIINGAIGSGFFLTRFDEHPAWENDRVPGEFTLIAEKRSEEEKQWRNIRSRRSVW